MGLPLVERTIARMQRFALIPTPSCCAHFPNWLHTENADETATIRARPQVKPMPGAGTIRKLRTIDLKFRAAAPPSVAAIPQEHQMRAKFYSARDAAKNFGEMLEAADAEPVIVRRHGRPRAAVIGWRLFEHYKKAYDDAFDERQIDLLELRLKAVAEGKLGRSDRARALGERLKRGEAMLSDTLPSEHKDGA
jgi:prevent-host-death family protein